MCTCFEDVCIFAGSNWLHPDCKSRQMRVPAMHGATVTICVVRARGLPSVSLSLILFVKLPQMHNGNKAAHPGKVDRNRSNEL